LVASFMKDIICWAKYDKERNPKDDFLKLLKLSLWANRHDLSATAGSPCGHTGDPLEKVESFNENIVVNDWKIVWDIVNKNIKKIDDIHIVLDNAGYELFTDLCLAAFFDSYCTFD